MRIASELCIVCPPSSSLPPMSPGRNVFNIRKAIVDYRIRGNGLWLGLQCHSSRGSSLPECSYPIPRIHQHGRALQLVRTLQQLEVSVPHRFNYAHSYRLTKCPYQQRQRASIYQWQCQRLGQVLYDKVMRDHCVVVRSMYVTVADGCLHRANLSAPCPFRRVSDGELSISCILETLNETDALADSRAHAYLTFDVRNSTRSLGRANGKA